MSVNIRIKYLGDSTLTKRNRPYRMQLDYSLNGKRIRETIKDTTFYPNDSKDIKKEKERIIERIKSQLEIDLGNSKNGLVSRQLQKANFIQYFEELGKKKEPNTKTAWESTLKHLIKFQGEKITFEQITTNWLEKYLTYLKLELSNGSVLTYFNKINAALNQAVKEKIIVENPIKYIDKPKEEETEIIFLSKEEIQTIINTDFYDNEVKNAFLLSCCTGLRASDIKELKWNHISNDKIQLIQTKTKNVVSIPLNPSAINILEKQKHNNEFVFNLSKHQGSTNRTIKTLIKKAGINKDIHFHCARHTFATLLVTSGVNILTISKLMGHRDIKSTLVYAKVIDEEKDKAINSMVEFNF